MILERDILKVRDDIIKRHTMDVIIMRHIEGKGWYNKEASNTEDKGWYYKDTYWR